MKIPSTYLPEYRHLNKKLIPANIVLLVLAIVACVAQIFMPLYTMKVELPEGSVTQLVRTLIEAEEEEEEEDGTEAAQSADAEEDTTDADDGSASGSISTYAVEFLDKIDSYFGYMPEFSFTVTFSPLALVTSPKDDIDAFAEWFAGLFPSGEEMDELAVDVFSPMIAGLVNTEIVLMMNGNKLNAKFEKIIERTEEDITTVFTDLATGNAAEARTAFNAYLLKVGRFILFGVPAGRDAETDEDWDDSDVDYDELFDAALTRDLDETEQAKLDETIADYMDIFDQILAYGEADGDESTFSMERAIGGFFDYELSGYIAAGAELTANITSFLTDPSAFMETWFKDMLADTGIESMIEEKGWTFDAIMITIFILLCAFPAALWLIQAIAAFTHLFRRNKKVAMWYTKLVCIWPCILFFILPCVLLAVLPGAMGMEGLLTGIAITIGGSGIVTGICYLLMWAVSIFMCFPVKRKLRNLKAEIKAR